MASKKPYKSDRDVNTSAKRAAHFADQARAAFARLVTAKTPAARAEHLGALTHAESRATVHANHVTKNSPGSELADEATGHAHVAKSMLSVARSLPTDEATDKE